MRALLFLTVLAITIAACDKSGTDLPIQHPTYTDRLTVAELHNEAAVITAFCGDTSFLYLTVENHASYSNLVIDDDSLLWNFLGEISNWGVVTNAYGLNGCLPEYHSFVLDLQDKEIRVTLSGSVKEKLVTDFDVSGLDYTPFVVREIEKTPSCAVAYEASEEPVPFQNTRWEIMGLLKNDAADTIYPPCEYSDNWIRFNTEIAEYHQPPGGPSFFTMDVYTGAIGCNFQYFLREDNSLFTNSVCILSVPYTTEDVVQFCNKIFTTLDGESVLIRQGNRLLIESEDSGYTIFSVAAATP